MIIHTFRSTILRSAGVLLAVSSLWHPTAARAQSDTRPGDDFFAWANRAWLKGTVIPAGKERWGPREEINELTRQHVVNVLDDARSAPAGSAARKVADFRAAYLNESIIEAKGIAPLQPSLDSIESVRDKSALTRLLGRGMRADVDPLNWGAFRSSHILGLSVEESIHGEKMNVAFLLQGGLGLPDRENYVSTESRMQALRIKYVAYIAQVLAFAGFDHGQERATAVMALETAIAQSQATREASANDRNADNVWTRADFARKAPGMDWNTFFVAAGLARQDAFVAWQPTAVTGMAALVASQPLDAWRDYLRFHLINDHADVLPRAFSAAALTMRGELAGQPLVDTRAQRALAATQLAMSDAIGRLYAERYFPAEQKRRVQGIVANVTAAFTKRVAAAAWMSPATKTQALAKLKSLYVGIGYPDRWQDYSDLKVDSLDALGNARRAEDRNYRRTVARIGQPVDLHEWWIAPQVVGAILVFQLNAYHFPAALLQAPKYDPTASDAASYGAIGAIIGHDISHYVDKLGADYDTTGAMRPWWTAEEKSRFEQLSAPLVKQFSDYRPFTDASVDGRLTASENIADLAGLAAAFDAYRLTLGGKVSDKSFVRQHDREFFLAFAQSWRVAMTERGLRIQLANDHAPETYRVATVRNFDAWYDAFDVKPGQQLYLEPKARVRVW